MIKTKSNIADTFKSVRESTFNILRPLQIEDYVVQTADYMSPPRWHLGHTTWFYDQLLRKYNKSFKPFEKDYSFYFNSYYLTFGKLFNKARRGTLSRPTVAETYEYAEYINQQTADFLSDNSNLTEDAAKKFELAFQHEYQHQELLVYDILHLLQHDYQPVHKNLPPQVNGGTVKQELIKIPGGMFTLGFDPSLHNEMFAYDVEMPAHKIYLNDYYIDKYPVTNGQYLEFILDGGYSSFKYWLSEGWDTINKNGWDSPLYWLRDETGKWYKYDFRGKHFIEDIANEPVTHISYFEADAYAKWKGMRLPTEAEWEKAASFNEDLEKNSLFPWGDEEPSGENSNLLENYYWSTVNVNSFPAGKSYYGCMQMCGDAWEWTSSEFMPYPGFKSGFNEYNDKWFGNKKVLRGGSYGTPLKQIKNTYRNFFACNERWMISGFRCAKSV